MRQTYPFDANQQPPGGMRPEAMSGMDGRGGYPGMAPGAGTGWACPA